MKPKGLERLGQDVESKAPNRTVLCNMTYVIEI